MPNLVKPFARGCAALLAVFVMFLNATPVFAVPSYEDKRLLLQKGLNLYEIERELDRLNEEEQQLKKDLASLSENIRQQEELVAQTRLHAGRVLRIYYQGGRIPLFLSLFHLSSFNDLLTVLQYLKMILSRDHLLLKQYADAYKKLQTAQRQLSRAQTELLAVKEEYLKRRDELIRLQNEVKQWMEEHPEDEKLVEDLTRQWEQTGVPLFKDYFRALSDAMLKMDEMLAKNKLIVDGKFQLTEDQLNEFLRSQNELFRHLTFSFETERVVAQGEKSGVSAKIVGHYTVENEKVNAIRFHIDELWFNDFSLPDTTIRDLQEQFDLSFYPQNVVSFIRVEKVRIEPGKLIAEMRLNFGF